MAQTITSPQAKGDLSQDAAASAAERLHAARSLLKQNRTRGLAALNELFREGRASIPPGRCAGGLVTVNIAPGLTQLVNGLLRLWLPWKGKTFDADRAQGDNIFSRSAYFLSHVNFPFYRGYVDDGPRTFRAFAFRTYIAPGKEDPDRQVLKIDYDLPANPPLSVRRVLDELVEIGDGYYLGKAHLHWWWGRWQMVAFFTLRNAD